MQYQSGTFLKHGVIAVLMTIFFSAGAAFAQQQRTAAAAATTIDAKIAPEKLALVKEFYEVTGGREKIRETIDVMHANIDNSMRMMHGGMSGDEDDDDKLTAAERAERDKKSIDNALRISRRIRADLDRELDMAAVIEEITFQLIDKYFTAADLKDLIAFYRTPTGRKALMLQPQIAAEAGQLTNAALAPVLQRVIKKNIDEIQREKPGETSQRDR